jgi:hypothetical protein
MQSASNVVFEIGTAQALVDDEVLEPKVATGTWDKWGPFLDEQRAEWLANQEGATRNLRAEGERRRLLPITYI